MALLYRTADERLAELQGKLYTAITRAEKGLVLPD